jgi:hypothetical protein
MPCRCDDYNPGSYSPPNPNIAEVKKLQAELEHEHTLRCKSQSLAHKLGKLLEENDISIPKAIKTSLEEARSILLKHKKDELKNDHKKLLSQINKMENNHKAIAGLGGLVKQEELDKVIELREEYKRLTKVSDKELLG